MTMEQKFPTLPDQNELDPNSLAAIRELLATEAPVKPKPVAERVAETAALAVAAPEVAPRDAARTPAQNIAEPQPQITQRAAKKAAKRAKKVKAPKAPGLIDDLKAKVMGYRPTLKHILIGTAVLFVLFRPWVVFALFLLTAFLITAIFLILGYDGFWRRVMGVARWYARRHPSRSEELHRKMDDFAVKFDAFLDRFPEGSVDGLYLPDFGDLGEANARHGEALDRRFDSLRENQA